VTGEPLAGDSELLEVLFDRAPLGVAVYDPDLVLRRFNRTFAELVEKHIPADSAPLREGRSLFDYIPDSEDRLRPVAQRVLRGESLGYRGVAHVLDGVRSYWDLVLVPLRADGRVVGLVEVAIDATARTLAEERLTHRERRLRSILVNSSDVTVVVGEQGELRWAAPSARRLLEPPRDAGPAGPGVAEPRRDVMAVTHPDDRAPLAERLAASAGIPGEGPPFRCRLWHVDGRWHTFEVVPVNLLDDPDVGGLVLHARDISERSEAEVELRRRDAILEAVRFAAHRFLGSHTSWRVHIQEVMANLGRAAAVSRVYIFENYRGADGTSWTSQSHEWVAPGISAQIDNAELATLPLDDPAFAELAGTMAEGHAIAGNVADLPESARDVLERQGILSLVLVPVFVDGRWWGMIGFDECVAERSWAPTEIDALRAAASTLGAAVQRQRSEDQLREQQAQYRQVFEATGDGLVITDLDSRLVHANPAFYRMHGYRPEELHGSPASTWIHPDFHRSRISYTAAVVAGDRPKAHAVDVRKDGSTFPVQVHGSAFTFQGRPHVLGVVRDDTERTQAFELLEKRVSALSTIAAGLTVNQRLTDTMQVIARSVVAATPAIAASAYVVDVGTGRLRVSAAVGLPAGYAEAIERCWAVEPNLTSRMGTAADPLIVRNAPERILANPGREPIHDLVRDVEWDLVAAIPLEVPGRALGSVNAYYPKGVEPSSDDLAFLRAVADQGTVAVENARLLAEAQSKAGLEERQRLARELHDSVSQALYGIALGARTAKAVAGPCAEQLAEPLEYILSLAEAGMTEMRSLIFELRPESLVTEGLVAALEKRVAVLRARHQLVVDAELCAEPDVAPSVKETLYRIAQEALHNAVKHAHATRVELRLVSADGRIDLEVGDDGVGFDPGEPHPGHLGLQSMRERAAEHGGTVRIHSVSARSASDGDRTGTTVRARLPMGG
jgi:PAS domain S-box-containing protein